MSLPSNHVNTEVSLFSWSLELNDSSVSFDFLFTAIVNREVNIIKTFASWVNQVSL